MLSNLTLGKKIALLTTLGLILGIGGLGSLGIRAVNQATDVMLQDRLTTAGLLADRIDETLARTVSEIEYAAQTVNPARSDLTFQAQVQPLKEALSRLAVQTHGIYLIDQQGQLIAAYPGTGASFKLDLYPTISESRQQRRTTISDLVRTPVDDIPVVLLTTPLAGERGLLIVGIEPAKSSIGGFVQPIRLGRTGYVEVVDQNGIVIARTEPGPRVSGFEQSDHSGRFAQLIAAGEATRGVCHTCHEPQQVEKKDVLAFVPLSRAKWGVVIRQSEDEALSPVRELRGSLLFFGIGLGILTLIFVLVITRNVTRRIALLTGASRRIAGGDLTSTVPASGKDEVGMLAQSFDDMRMKLKSSYDELEKKTNELSSLLSVSEILNSALDLPDLLHAVVAKAVEVIPGADAGALLLTRADRLALEYSVGLDAAGLTEAPEFQPASEPGADKQEAIAASIGSFLSSNQTASRAKSSIFAEVSQRGHSTGALLLLSFKDAEAFSNADRRLLQGIADNIAVLLEKAYLGKQAEDARAIQEADKLRKEFISSVSHELRTPLTLIKGYSTSLLRQDVSWDTESQRQFLSIIDEKTDELRGLIDKLLESAKLEAGALRLEKEPLLLPQLARKVIDEISPRAKNYGFVLDFTHPFPVIEADVRCIKQVMYNLIENAVKYSPEGSEVRISGNIEEGKVVIGVRDSGIGIPLEHQGKIFDRFYRVNTGFTHGIPGSGLGLAIVKGHIEAHGGKVWFESESGKGSTFYFSLPRETGGDREDDE